jgi:Tfp pilus assembly protein PilF
MRIKAIAVVTLCASLAFCASSQTKVQRARDKDPKYQYNLGLFYLNQSDVETAVKYFIRSLTLDTRYYLAWNALGLAHSMRGRLDESAKAYLKCLEIDPRFSEAYNNLGTVYQGMDQLDKAEEAFRKALADLTYLNRELPYTNLARLYVLQGRLDEALENADKAIQLKPRLAMAHNIRGLVLEKKNDLAGAVLAYEQAVKIVPDDLLFSYNLGLACFRNAEYARAKEVLLKIQGKVTDAETKESIARTLRLIGEQK